MDNDLTQKSTNLIIREYANLFRRWIWLLIIFALIGGGIAYYVSSRQSPTYKTSTLVQLSFGSSSQYDYYAVSYYGQEMIQTYTKIITGQTTLDKVSELVGYDVKAGMISAAPVTGTQLMTITVTDTNPSRAAIIANTLVQVFAKQIQLDRADYYAETKTILEEQIAEIDSKIQDLINQVNNELLALGPDETESLQLSQLESTLTYYQQRYFSLTQNYQQLQLVELQNQFNITQIDPAGIPSTPSAPKPLQSALMGALVGLFIAAGLVVLVEFLDDSIKDPQDITKKWGLPILGVIANYETSDENPLITVQYPRSPVAEAFRSLRTNLQFTSIDNPLKTILVTSCLPGEGKTHIAVNLSVVMANTNQSLVLIDADLRRPKVHKLLKLHNRIGLTDLFIRLKKQTIDSIRQSSNLKSLHYITSGSLPPNPSELLSSDKMVEILSDLKSEFNTIIIDSPPLLIVPDAVALATRVDGVLLVFRPSVTKRNELARGIELLRQLNTNILGVVINNVKVKNSSIYYRNYYANDSYGKNYYHPKDEQPADKQI